MPKAKEEHEYEDDNDRGKSVADERSEKESDSDESKEPTKRFERPDNLRRRSEWFQKRTSGG
jgi:hypothetical protein